MQEGLNNLEKVTNRRKALVWVSEGYDFNPFQNSRFGLLSPDSPFLQNQSNLGLNQSAQADPTNPDAQYKPNQDPITNTQIQNETFSDADLAYELSEITRAANRANTTIYTLDPRGLVAGQDIDEPVDPQEWSEHLRKTQDTMRVLAEDTGGIAVVNQNDFDKALKRIDADSSDYYILGYYSSNPDPTHRRRKVEVKTIRGGLDVFTRTEYLVLKPPPPPVPSSRK
jgi:VWFA-related protein